MNYVHRLVVFNKFSDAVTIKTEEGFYVGSPTAFGKYVELTPVISGDPANHKSADKAFKYVFEELERVRKMDEK